MVNIYDTANLLASQIRETEEYKEYQRLNEAARQDDTNRTLMDEYKRLQYKMQASLVAGGTMSEDDVKRMQQIGSLLQFNQDASAAMLAEFRLQKLIADIYKIIADAAGIDLGALR